MTLASLNDATLGFGCCPPMNERSISKCSSCILHAETNMPGESSHICLFRKKESNSVRIQRQFCRQRNMQLSESWPPGRQAADAWPAG
mmetsp:Transcript_111063/g.220937  ORF Transcript_111063/g.220937 Transcript_111063/m.220937 type:complete len:88 (-) Transcript_111063:42-305(-)